MKTGMVMMWAMDDMMIIMAFSWIFKLAQLEISASFIAALSAPVHINMIVF